MTIFQIIILIFIIIVILKSARRAAKKEISFWLFALWTIFWILVAVVDLFPVIINKLADLLKVGRGVDLMIYLALFVLFYLVFRLTLNINKTNKNLSEIVRKIALDRAEIEPTCADEIEISLTDD